MTDLITEARELCENAETLVNELHTERLDYDTEYLPLIDAIQTILPLCDALEKAERESGCEWCADNYDHRHKTMFRKGSDWHYEAKYCDMCGKRLEVKP